MPLAEYAKGDIVRAGKRIYEERLRTLVEPDNTGRYLVLDVDTGEYEVGDELLTLTQRFHERQPDAPLYMMRIGHRTASRIGSGGTGATR